MPRRILVLHAHPAARRSRLNRAMADAAREVDGVTLHDLYDTYPDFAVDVDAEQALLDAHDALVVQHPMFWYSAPALVKEWLDLVLEHGWAYGHEGRHLAGKPWLQAVTTGGREAAYGPGGLNRYGIDDLLRPFEATANLCRAVWLPPFVIHGAHLAEAREIAAAADRYRDALVHLRDRSDLDDPAPARAAEAST